MGSFDKKIRDKCFRDKCFDISNNLLSILSNNFSSEFISLDDFLKIDGNSIHDFFYYSDYEGNLEEFCVHLEGSYRDEDFDECYDKIIIRLNRNGGIVYYFNYCLYQGDTTILEDNKVRITRSDNNSFILSYSKSVSNGFYDYEDNDSADFIEIEDCSTNNLFEVLSKSVDQKKILK